VFTRLKTDSAAECLGRSNQIFQMFQFAPLVVVCDSEQTSSLQEVVPIGTIIMVLRSQILHLGLEERSRLLRMDQCLAMVALLVLDGTQVKFVEGILVRDLFEIKLRLIDLT